MDKPAQSSWPRKLAWLAAIWTVSVALLAIVAGAMRLVMNAVGLTV